MKVYRKNGNVFELRIGLTDAAIKSAFEWPHREVYTVIQNLTKGEEVQGKVLNSGNIQVNGASALRRTISGLTLQVSEGALAQDYNWVMTDQIKVFQGISNKKTNNEVWYFNLGTFCLSSFSANESLQGTKINISGKDKMVLLNGEQGGTFAVDTELHIRTKSDGTDELIPIDEIIKNLLEYADIPEEQVHILGLEGVTGRELLEYRGTDPLYIFSKKDDDDKTQIVNYTIYKDYLVNDTQTVSDLGWGQTLETPPNGYSDYVRTVNIAPVGADATTRILTGEVAGYKVTPLTYPGELKAVAGETVTSVLDKIVNTLGREHEYFFDEEGEFYFQKKKALLSMSRSNDTGYSFNHSGEDDTTAIYTFTEKQLLTSLSRQPKIENIKNDFVIWGTRPSATGKDGIPIHARYVLDEPFVYYSNWRNNIEQTTNGAWVWKSGAALLKTTSSDATVICEQLYQMATHRGTDGDYILIPAGKEYYKKFFPDILAYWRQVYNPTDSGEFYLTESTITSGSMKPTHWFGNTIPQNKQTDYGNIYIPKKITENGEEKTYYVSAYDSMNLSNYYDIFDANQNSIYNKTNYENQSVIYLNGDKIQTFYDYIATRLGLGDWGTWDPQTGYNSTRIAFVRSLYYRKKGETEYKRLYEEIPLYMAKLDQSNDYWNNDLVMICVENAEDGDKNTTLVKELRVKVDGKDANYVSGHAYTSGYYCQRYNENQFPVLKEGYDANDSFNKKLRDIAAAEIKEYIPMLDDFPITAGGNIQFIVLQPNPLVLKISSVSASNSHAELKALQEAHNESIQDGIDRTRPWWWRYTYYFNYSDYSDYSFYIKKTDNNGEEIYMPWVDDARAWWFGAQDPKNPFTPAQNWTSVYQKNTWRFTTGYDLETEYTDTEKEKGLTLIPPLDTISFVKDRLYNTVQQLLSPTIPSDAIYLFPNITPTNQLKLLEETSPTSFLVRPTDWTGQIKSGTISKTVKHPVFAKIWEYNAKTGMRLKYEEDASLLPFELVWIGIQPNSKDELANCTITKTGLRSLVKNEKSVTGLKFQETLPLYFTATPGEELYLGPQEEKLFVLSSQGVSAEDYFKQLLFDHAYCNETATVNTIPLYFLQPNNYVEITEKDEAGKEQKHHYILSQFSIPLTYNGQMSLTLTKDKLARA